MAVFTEQDLFPSLIANAQGDIQTSNSQARAQFQAFPGARLENCLRSMVANPSAILLRLQSLAEIYGKAREDIVTVGSTIPISVFSVGNGAFCWRFHLDTPGQWDEVGVPILTEGRNGVLLRVNAAAEHLLGKRPETLHQVMPGEQDHQEDVAQIQTANGPVPALLRELNRSGSVRDLLVLPVDDTRQGGIGTSFADLPVPIMKLTPDGIILEANRLAAKLIGHIEPGETNVDQIMHGLGHPILDWLARTAAQEPAMRSEFLRLTRQDKEVFVQVDVESRCAKRSSLSDRGFERCHRTQNP